MALHVQYLINAQGQIALPPDGYVAQSVLADPRWSGYELREANTLDEVDRLTQRLNQQARDEAERDGLREQAVWAERLEQQRSAIAARIASSATSEYEKEFLRHWLLLRDEKKKAAYKSRFACDQAYFELREHDHARNPEETLKESL